VGHRSILRASAALIALGALVSACSRGETDAPATPALGPVALARERFQDSTFRVEYATSGPEGARFSDGSFTWYRDSTPHERIDLVTTQDGEDVAITFIESPDVSRICLDQAAELGALLGVAPEQGVCFTNPSGELQVDDLAGSLTLLEDEDAERRRGIETLIAGEVAVCFVANGGDVLRQCLSHDGVPLLVEYADGSRFEATEVSREVDDSDFALPYELHELPEL
jgi:hypothetical protein